MMQLPIVKIGTNDNQRDPGKKRKSKKQKGAGKKRKVKKTNGAQARNEQERKGNPENRQGMVYGQESKRYLNERI